MDPDTRQYEGEDATRDVITHGRTWESIFGPEGGNGRIHAPRPVRMEAKGLLAKVAEQQFGKIPSAEEWVANTLKFHLWSAQKAILESIQRHRYTAVPSGHDISKSHTAACATCWWLSVHDVGSAFVVSTAPTAAQVQAILWREIEKMHRRGHLPGQINLGGAPEWKIGKELVGYGRKPADYDETSFQGIHSLYPLVIVDEAAGIPRLLWDAIDALATNENARVLAIGNPDDRSSHFKTICGPDSGWNVIHLDGLRSPNFTEEAVRAVSELPDCGDLYRFMVENNIPFSEEQIPHDLSQVLLSTRWVGERMKRWGVHRTTVPATETAEEKVVWQTSALWEARVRGLFPTDTTEGVIPLGWVLQAVDRWRNFKGKPEEIPGVRVFGCDVGYTGPDETAISERQGHYVFGVDRAAKQDTMTTALRLAHRLDNNVQSYAVVDVIGVGAGVVDRLREMGRTVVAFSAAARTDAMDSTGEFTFPNVRSAAWWHLRELLDPSNPATSLCIPDDEQLIADLVAPRWRVVPGARIMVEPKEDTIKRLGRSPDSADCVTMSCWQSGLHGAKEAVVAEWDSPSDYAVEWQGEMRMPVPGTTTAGQVTRFRQKVGPL